MTVNGEDTSTLARRAAGEDRNAAAVQGDGLPAGGDAILRAMVERRSVRAFADKPVAHTTVESILDAARWAPSGANIQPWEVHALSGRTKERFTQALLDARADGVGEHADYQYYPVDWFEPYKSRRMALGISMYKAYGARRSRESREESWNRNYAFFGAPVGLLFFIHRDLAKGSWLDYGLFLQNIMLAARAHGLETCPQASLSDYPDQARTVLGLGPEKLLVCGISLGYPNWDEAVNGFDRTRVDVADFTTFHD